MRLEPRKIIENSEASGGRMTRIVRLILIRLLVLSLVMTKPHTQQYLPRKRKAL